MKPSDLLSLIIILCTARLIFGMPFSHLSPDMSAALHLLTPEATVLFGGACLGEHRCSEAEVEGYAWLSSQADDAVRKRFWHTYDCAWDEDLGLCPVDGGWSAWSEWGGCDTTCGDGTKLRYRACDWPPPKNGGNQCHGQATSVTSCRVRMACPPPENGTRVNSRESPGDSVQQKAFLAMEPFNMESAELQAACMEGHCSYQQVTEMVTPRNLADIYWTNLICYKHLEGCPVDGGWLEWSPWSSCSSRCGTGKAYRSRRCAGPRPRHGGRYCVGPEYEEGTCFDDSCVGAVGVLLTPWTMWSACSATCNEGVRTSTRRCHGSDACDVGNGQVAAVLRRETPCSSGGLCPELGGWGEWSTWTVCSAICSTGRRVRERACNKPRAQGEGNECAGEPTMEGECSQNAPYCLGIPEDVTMYEEWSYWSECSALCDGGMKIRHRTCMEKGHPCRGELYDLQTCNEDKPCKVDGGWTEWAEWSVCSVTCGEGLTERYRRCSHPRPEFGGLSCEGDAVERKKCLQSECPAGAPTWQSWGGWSQCSVTCAGGTSTRTRGCSVQYANADEPWPVAFSRCVGEYEQINVCNFLPCPEDGNWASWGDWAGCSRSCGDGVVKRDRTCTDPAPAGGGEVCGGYGTEVVPCYQQPCPDPDQILRTFDGSSFMMYHGASAPSKLLLLHLRFRPSGPSGLLALRHDDDIHRSEQVVTVGVADGRARVYAKVGQAESAVVSPNGIRLGKWNSVEVTISGGHTRVRLNDGAAVSSNFTVTLPARLDWDQSMYIGGALPYLFPGPAREYVGFVGTISTLRVNYKEYTLHDIRPEWIGVGLPFVSFNVGTLPPDINAQVAVFSGREYTSLPCPPTTDGTFSLRLTFRPDGPEAGIISYITGLVPGSFVALAMVDRRVALFVSLGDSTSTAKSAEIALTQWGIVELTLRGREAEMRLNGGPAVQLTLPGPGAGFAPADRVRVGGVPGPDRPVARLTTGGDRGLGGAVYSASVNRHRYLLTETAINTGDVYLDSASTTISAHYREVRRPRHSSVALHCNYANIRKEKPTVTWLHGDRLLENSAHVTIIKPRVYFPHKSILSLHILKPDTEGPYACMVWYRGKAIITHAFGVSIYEPQDYDFHLESNVELMVLVNVALIVGFVVGIIALSCFRACRRRYFFLDMMYQSTVFCFGLDTWAWLRDPSVPDRATVLQVNATFDRAFSACREKIKFDQALRAKAKKAAGKLKRTRARSREGGSNDRENAADATGTAAAITVKPNEAPEEIAGSSNERSPEFSQEHIGAEQSAGEDGVPPQRKPSESLSDGEIGLRRLSHEIVTGKPESSSPDSSLGGGGGGSLELAEQGSGDSVSSLVIPEGERTAEEREGEEPLYVILDTIRERRRQSKSSAGRVKLSPRGSPSPSDDSEPPPAPPRLLSHEEAVEVDMDAVREDWRQSNVSREMLSDRGAAAETSVDPSARDRRCQSAAQAAGHEAGRLFSHRGSIGGAVTKLSEAVAEDVRTCADVGDGLGGADEGATSGDETQDEGGAGRELSLVLEEDEDREDQPLLASASDEDEDGSPDDLDERDSSE